MTEVEHHDHGHRQRLRDRFLKSGLDGFADYEVIELNQDALSRMQGDHQLEIVEGATHLFEEPGTLERVARLARDWFRQHLARAPQPIRRAG